MNILATLLHKLGDAAACGEQDPDYDKVILEELTHLQENDTTLHEDLRKLKEVIGYLGQRLKNMECSTPQHETKIIKMK